MAGNTKQKHIVKTDDKSLFNALVSGLKKGKKVKLTGIGIFELRQMRQRKILHPVYRKIHLVPAHRRVVFKPSQTFKNAVCH